MHFQINQNLAQTPPLIKTGLIMYIIVPGKNSLHQTYYIELSKKKKKVWIRNSYVDELARRHEKI